ncbi:uncharacterized protein LOC110248532 [Exaiptasia diaphana]|uniref:ShKT domain-containing protein n=1 Tax=Exaiptasia diaphana TaxID=2652724 RepID=A0A913YRY7_EXADI|nr:uncharacterized protein LOC110248532 [Exaiptasia diaphana]KXJ08639.1 hypothetical protein AC249_AIPGENE6587 [Exaiptasia diaphana]
MSKGIFLVIVVSLAVVTSAMIDVPDDVSAIDKRGCEDKFGTRTCKKFQRLCSSNRRMSENCRLTCKVCKPEVKCFDIFPSSCSRFSYHCKSSRWMKFVCNKTCRRGPCSGL